MNRVKIQVIAVSIYLGSLFGCSVYAEKPQFSANMNAPKVEYKEIITYAEASNLGLKVTPLAVNDKSLHPNGPFYFRLNISGGRLEKIFCTSVIDFRIISENYDLIYSEDITINREETFERIILLKRPNQLIIFFDFERCDEYINRNVKKVFSFNINDIYADKIPLSDKHGNEIRRDFTSKEKN